jgi:hypothetical protein
LIETGSVPASLFVDGEGTLDQLPDLFRSMASENRAVKTFIQTSPSKQL